MSRIIYIVVGLVGTVLLLRGWWCYFDLRIRTATAEDQTEFFEEALEAARSTPTTVNTSEWIDAVKIYYPSGTKQIENTHLDWIVERSRRMVLNELNELLEKPEG